MARSVAFAGVEERASSLPFAMASFALDVGGLALEGRAFLGVRLRAEGALLEGETFADVSA